MRRPLSVICLFAVILLFFGTKMIKESPPEYVLWEGQEITVTGKVYKKEVTGEKDRKRQLVYLKLITVENQQEKRKVIGDDCTICYLDADEEMPKMGSIIRASGKMRCFESASNPGQFDAKSYYHVLIHCVCNNIQFQKSTHKFCPYCGQLLYVLEEGESNHE